MLLACSMFLLRLQYATVLSFNGNGLFALNLVHHSFLMFPLICKYQHIRHTLAYHLSAFYVLNWLHSFNFGQVVTRVTETLGFAHKVP